MTVLIMVIHLGFGTAAINPEFTDKEHCEAALKVIKEIPKAEVIWAVCVPK